jgi:DNA-binding NarL/FixJ family response regulator
MLRTVQDSYAVDTRVRLVIVEEDPLLRAGVNSIMKLSSRIEVVGDASSIRQVLANVPEIRPDVLVVGSGSLRNQLNITIPHSSGERHELSLVAVLDPADQGSLRNALMSSVRGFVDRNSCDNDLINGVLEAYSGRTYVSSAIAEAIIGWILMRIEREPVSGVDVERLLTRRELEILGALGKGLTNTAIARQLCISEATVRSHTYHILTKLNLRTRTEAVLIGHAYPILQGRQQES